MAETISQHDQRKRHCPLLGHEIHFGYCRAPGSELPCRKIFDCWFRIFDIIKPPPANWFDREMKNGLGVTLYDIMAGVYAAIALRICLGIFWLGWG